MKVFTGDLEYFRKQMQIHRQRLHESFLEVERVFEQYKFKVEPNNKRRKRGLSTRRRLKWQHKHRAE